MYETREWIHPHIPEDLVGLPGWSEPVMYLPPIEDLQTDDSEEEFEYKDDKDAVHDIDERGNFTHDPDDANDPATVEDEPNTSTCKSAETGDSGLNHKYYS